MTENPLDKKVFDALSDLEVPYDPSSWDFLQQKLDNLPSSAPAADKAGLFDERLKNMLSDLEAPYQSASWNALSEKMDRKDATRRIRLHKMAEAAIFLLLIANVNAIFENGCQLFRMPLPKEEAVPEDNRLRADARKSAQNPAGSITGSGEVRNISPLPTGMSLQTDLLRPISDEEYLTAVASTVGADMATGNQVIPAGLRPMTLLAALGFDPVQVMQESNLVWQESYPFTAPRQGKGYLAVSGAWMSNTIREENGYQTHTNSFPVGLHYGRRNHRWGIEGGLQYASVQYGTDTRVLGFYKENDLVYGTSLDQVTGNVLSVPVMASRKIAGKGRHSVRATAGFAAHIALEKGVSTKSIAYGSAPQGQLLGTTPPAAPEFKGWAEGGKLADNIQTSVNAGLRYEYKVTPGVTAFAEGQYRMPLAGKGFGPAPASSRGVGLTAGVMTAIARS